MDSRAEFRMGELRSSKKRKIGGRNIGGGFLLKVAFKAKQSNLPACQMFSKEPHQTVVRSVGQRKSEKISTAAFVPSILLFSVKEIAALCMCRDDQEIQQISLMHLLSVHL